MFDFNKDVATIGGWLTKEEGKFLYKSAKKLSRNDRIIEIGSWKGRSTICFGLGAKDGNGSTIYAIDPHTGSSEHIKRFGKVDTYQEFLTNINSAGVKRFIKPLKNTSEEAAKNFNYTVNFVLVDGAHEYRYVKKDFSLWFPKLMNGGVIAFHDCWQTLGVHLFTTQILFFSSKVCNPKLLDTLTVMEKVEQNSIIDRAYNFLFVFYRLFVGWIGVVKMDYYGTVLK